MKRLDLADAVLTDVNSRLVSALVDGKDGVGIQAKLTGGWTDSDVENWPYLMWRLKDVNGQNLDGSKIFNMPLIQVQVRGTEPGLTSDLIMVGGIANESALSGGTIDAVGCGLEYTGGARNINLLQITAGSCVFGHDTGGGSTLRAAILGTGRMFAGASTLVIGDYTRGFSAAGAFQSASAINSTSSKAFGNGGAWAFLAFGRLSTVAGEADINVDIYHNPTIQVPWKT